MNRFVLEDEDIIILGEKENQDVKSNGLSDSIRGIADDNDNEDTAKNLNGRMDANGRVHDTLGQFMAKAGFTSKPSLTTAVEEVVETAETGEMDGGETSENAIIE